MGVLKVGDLGLGDEGLGCQVGGRSLEERCVGVGGGEGLVWRLLAVGGGLDAGRFLLPYSSGLGSVVGILSWLLFVVGASMLLPFSLFVGWQEEVILHSCLEVII